MCNMPYFIMKRPSVCVSLQSMIGNLILSMLLPDVSVKWAFPRNDNVKYNDTNDVVISWFNCKEDVAGFFIEIIPTGPIIQLNQSNNNYDYPYSAENTFCSPSIYTLTKTSSQYLQSATL